MHGLYSRGVQEPKYRSRLRQDLVFFSRSWSKIRSGYFRLEPEMGGVSYFWLRLHSYSDKFNSDFNPTPKNLLIAYFDSEIFKVWETYSDVKITFHASVIFGFDRYETPTPFRLQQQIYKKRTPTPLRIRQKTPYSDSGFCPSLIGTGPGARAGVIFHHSA